MDVWESDGRRFEVVMASDVSNDGIGPELTDVSPGQGAGPVLEVLWHDDGSGFDFLSHRPVNFRLMSWDGSWPLPVALFLHPTSVHSSGHDRASTPCQIRLAAARAICGLCGCRERRVEDCSCSVTSELPSDVSTTRGDDTVGSDADLLRG